MRRRELSKRSARRDPAQGRRLGRRDAHPQLRLLPGLRRGRAGVLRGGVPARPPDAAARYGRQAGGAWPAHRRVRRAYGGRRLAGGADPEGHAASTALRSIACGVLTGLGAVVNTAKVAAGSSAVVIGCGGVGLNAVQGARLSGCSPIIAVDVADSKLEAALAFGATHTINAKTEDVAATRRRTDQRPQGGHGLRDRRREGGGRAGRVADEAQRRDRARRHAALGRPRDDRSRLARRRRPAHPRLEDGLGPPGHRRAEDRRALSGRAAQAR